VSTTNGKEEEEKIRKRGTVNTFKNYLNANMSDNVPGVRENTKLGIAGKR
jgi:hypothetical protein